MSAAGSTTSFGERVVGVGERRLSWLALAQLYFICDLAPGGRSVEDVLRPALQSGADIVQLRDKWASENELVNAARIFRRLCDAYDALFIVNDRPDLALACCADGVHLGQNDISASQARRVVGNDLLIGLSTHTEGQIEAALSDGACDYISTGPVFETPTKPDYEAVGLELVRHAAQSIKIPFFAIGGIDTENIETVVAAGAQRVAVVRAIAQAAYPEAAAKKLKRQLFRTT